MFLDGEEHTGKPFLFKLLLSVNKKTDKQIEKKKSKPHTHTHAHTQTHFFKQFIFG